MLKLIFYYEIDLKTSSIINTFRIRLESLSPAEYKQFKLFYSSNNETVIGKIMQAKKENHSSEVNFEQVLEDFNGIFKDVITSDMCFDINKSKDISSLLIILSINSADLALSHSAIELMYLLYSQSILIKDTLTSMQLVSSAGLHDYEKVEKIAALLCNISESCGKWYVLENAQEHQ